MNVYQNKNIFPVARQSVSIVTPVKLQTGYLQKQKF